MSSEEIAIMLSTESKIPLQLRMVKAIQRADKYHPRKPSEERTCVVRGRGDNCILAVLSDGVEVAHYTYGELAG
jgi:hypothetical protein